MDLESLYKISYGVYLATSQNKEIKAGCVVNSVIQVSSEPPYLLLALNQKNTTTSVILESKKFGISVLSRQAPFEIIGTFGYYSSKEIDKFQNFEYFESIGIPVVKEGANAYYIVEVEKEIRVQSHLLLIGKVLEAKKLSEEMSLTYADYQSMKKGEKKSSETWICEVCGYEYHGMMREEKENYRCPICGVSKDKFYKK